MKDFVSKQRYLEMLTECAKGDVRMVEFIEHLKKIPEKEYPKTRQLFVLKKWSDKIFVQQYGSLA